MSHALDRPVWNALTGRQAHLAVAGGAAVRIDPGYGLFAGLRDASEDSWATLRATLQGAEDFVGLVEREAPVVPRGFAVLREAELVQMVWEGGALAPVDDDRIVLLGESDAVAMTGIAHATEPGPWGPATHRYGDYFGIRDGSRLAAMAGERLLLPGWAEVSGVCTWPEYRGRGYAEALMRRVMHGFQARGDRPFLHCYGHNAGAIRLYERMGFVIRARVTLLVLALA